jgi:hypothetical protein
VLVVHGVYVNFLTEARFRAIGAGFSRLGNYCCRITAVEITVEITDRRSGVVKSKLDV